MADLTVKKKVCSVDGCGRPCSAKGRCDTHYRRMRKGDMREDISSQQRQVGTCNEEGCDKPKRAKGFCKAHYKKNKESEVCEVKDCNREQVGKGLCNAHWCRKKKFGDVQEDIPIQEFQTGPCNAEGCDSQKYSKGFCRPHYSRLLKDGDIKASLPLQSYGGRKLSSEEYRELQDENQELRKIGKKRCYHCRKIQELSDFYPSRRKASKPSSSCSSCTRDYNLRTKYGISAIQFDEILKEQGYCCALCQLPIDPTKGRKFAVDHNHETGEMRAILCPYCNHALGLFEARGLPPQFVQDYIDQKGYFENSRPRRAGIHPSLSSCMSA